MQFLLEILFAISLLCIFYTYIGYLLILMGINRIFPVKNKTFPTNGTDIKISVIIPAYNEISILTDKIANTQNCLSVFSDAEVIVITDGSTDGSEKLQSQFSDISFMHQPKRKGKAAAINRAVKAAKGDVFVFTDANTVLNKTAVSNLVKILEQPNVGAVSGVKKVVPFSQKGADTESLYWQYESLLKKYESGFYSLSGAAGELIAVKKECFLPIWEKAILDDFMLSWAVIKQKKQVKICENAVATEKSSLSIKDELERKKRIAAGGFQSLKKLGWVFNFINYPQAFFIFFSHRICRWVLSPLSLILMFCLSLYCVLFYWQFLSNWLVGVIYFEVVFFVLAVLGFLLRNKHVNLLGFYLPFYFLLANVAEVIGFFNWITGKQTALWKKAGR